MFLIQGFRALWFIGLSFDGFRTLQIRGRASRGAELKGSRASCEKVFMPVVRRFCSDWWIPDLITTGLLLWGLYQSVGFLEIPI